MTASPTQPWLKTSFRNDELVSSSATKCKEECMCPASSWVVNGVINKGKGKRKKEKGKNLFKEYIDIAFRLYRYSFSFRKIN